MKPVTFDSYHAKYDAIRLERCGGVLEMTLHTSGDSLVFDRTIHEELGFAFADIAADRENRVVILSGSGENFCAKFDPESFKSFNGLGPGITATGWDQTHWRGMHNIRSQLDVPVPMIGVLNGPALAHSELALLCDIVLASETATIQDEPHFGNGVAPGDGVHIVFPLLMGINPGRYFLLTQQVLNAYEAKTAGLVNEVLAPDALLPRARTLAAMMVGKPPLALRYARQLLTHKLKQAIEEALPHGLSVEGLSAIAQFRSETEKATS